MSELRIDGKGFLVAAGAAAAGQTIARALARCGAAVVLCAPDSPHGGDVEADVCWLPADTSDEADVDRCFGLAMETLPSLDGAVIFVPAQAVPPLAQLSLQEWEAAVVRPLRGPFLLSRRVVEEFLGTQTPGRIILVAGWGRRAGAAPEGRPGPDGPGATPNQEVIHSALHSLARSLAKEYGRRGITCNVVVPGPPNVAADARETGVGMPGLPPADVSVIDTICFLASDEASFVNGEALVLTAAGETAQPPAFRR